MWAALYDKGKKVAFIDQVGGRSEIREISSTGGSAVTRFTAPKTLSLTSIAVTPTGGRFFVGGTTTKGSESRVYSLKAGSSKLRALTSAVQAFADSALSLSPSNNTLAYSPELFPPSTKGIRLIKVGRGGISKSISYQGDASTTTWSANGATIYNADQNANGWFRDSVKTGKSTALDFTSTGHYYYPVRAA